MFDNLSDKLDKALHVLRGHGQITEINVAETTKEIRRALLDADVNFKIAKEFTNNSLKAIGGHFGGRDHSTVIHSCQAVRNLIDTDEDFRDTVDELKKRIQLTV